MNRLAEESSPYLRQHADNPVDWYPWGPDAFAAAKLRDVPVLLSVGYSACHWCHVMAHESFEDDATAAVMNADFVCIKVDREERPDVDSIYMEAVQAVTGVRGLADDGVPAAGRPAVPRRHLLSPGPRSWSCWARSATPGGTAASTSTTPRPNWPTPSGPAPPCPVPGGRRPPPATGASLRTCWRRRPTPCWPVTTPSGAGSGGPRSFPSRPCWSCSSWPPTAPGRADVTAALTTTLDAMATGGIYDHLGGGFARYSTDRQWLVPHFEKMLYDNALLARVYLHAWQLTGQARYRQVVDGDLRLPAAHRRAPGRRRAGVGRGRRQRRRRRPLLRLGRDEVLEVGGPAAADWYGVTAAGNWEGHNILRRPLRSRAAPAGRSGGGAGQALLARRDRRVRPGLDDKVLTEWNAMAVAALAEAGAALGRARLGDRGRGARRTSCSTNLRRPRRAVAAQLAAATRQPDCRAGPATWPTPPTTPGWSRPSPGWPRPPGGRVGSTRPRAAADALLDLFVGRGLRRLPHDGPRRRSPHRPPDRQPGRRRAVSQLGRRHRPASPRRPDR